MTKSPLPVLLTVQYAYADVWDGRQLLIRAAGFWLALILLIDGVGAFLGFRNVEMGAENAAGAGYVFGAILSAVSTIVAIIGIAAIMVVWHRRILSNEPMAGPLAPVRRESIRYILMEIVVALIAATVTGTGVLISTLLGPLAPIGFMVSVIAGILISVRLTLILPAAAIGDTTMTLKKSWEQTKIHWFRLFAGSILAAIPIVVAAAVAQNLLELLGGAGSLIGEFIGLVGGVIQATVSAAYLSFCFIHITGAPSPSNAVT